MGFSRDELGGVWVIDCNQGLLQFEEETCEQNVKCDGLSPRLEMDSLKGGENPNRINRGNCIKKSTSKHKVQLIFVL